MAQLPDRFDLWVRRARQSADPARQLDWVLGALVALPEWHFLNIGSADVPQLASDMVERSSVVLIFTDSTRLSYLLQDKNLPETSATVTVPTAAALKWCMEQGCGLLVNPGPDAVLIPPDALAAFQREWLERKGALTSGFWMPHATSEEEDFWQQHGL